MMRKRSYRPDDVIGAVETGACTVGQHRARVDAALIRDGLTRRRVQLVLARCTHDIYSLSLCDRLVSSSNVMSHTHPFNGPFSGTTRVSRYQKSKTNLDFTEARDSEWQWHQLCHMQVYTSLQTDNHASTPPSSFLQAGRSSCRPTNSVKH